MLDVGVVRLKVIKEVYNVLEEEGECRPCQKKHFFSIRDEISIISKFQNWMIFLTFY